jgi:hypothetical protein
MTAVPLVTRGAWAWAWGRERLGVLGLPGA